MIGKEKYKEINALLNRRFAEKKTLIAVHRGAWGGSVIENTVPAYKAALDMGADMFECDVVKSTDGVLYTIHDTYEMRLLHKRRNIKTYSSGEIDKFRYYNCIGNRTEQSLTRLDEVLQTFCHGELFNIDRAWSILPELHEKLQQYPHALRQAVIKTPAKRDYLDFFEACETKYMYMPIVKTVEMLELALSCKSINTVGVELIPKTEDSPLFDEKLIAELKAQGLYVWVNALDLSDTFARTLSAGYGDTVSVSQGPEQGWGQLMEKGYNVIQTDWPAQLSKFRDEFHKLSRSPL